MWLNDIGTGNRKFDECECPSVWGWDSLKTKSTVLIIDMGRCGGHGFGAV